MVGLAQARRINRDKHGWDQECILTSSEYGRKELLEDCVREPASLFGEGKGEFYPRKYGRLGQCGGISLVGAKTSRALHLHAQRQRGPEEVTL